MNRSRNSASPPQDAMRELRDLISVGPATVRALHSLGVRSVSQLARQDASSLYRRLCRKEGQTIDPCCLDVLSAAVAQARDPRLPAEQRVWWYWSRRRKLSASA